MHARSAVRGDLAAITALYAVNDTHWFGAPEQDESEVDLAFRRVEPLDTRSRLLLDDDDGLVAFAWTWGDPPDTTLVVHPDVDQRAAYDDLLPWLRSAGAVGVEALSRDVVLLDALARHGWEHDRSSFELIRLVSDAWPVTSPTWPDDVRPSDLADDDVAAVHDLVYRRAGWSDVPGHHERPLEEWREIFVDDVPRDQLVLARAGDELVGVVLGRVWSDGTGWASQLAVAREHRGRGLGRALLLEVLLRLRAAGARQLGLGVSALNENALRLYLDVGLEVDREWRHHRPAVVSGS
ncbi:hypothetical protein GCM10027446_28640 [Angustibacter peucedani]